MLVPGSVDIGEFHSDMCWFRIGMEFAARLGVSWISMMSAEVFWISMESAGPKKCSHTNRSNRAKQKMAHTAGQRVLHV